MKSVFDGDEHNKVFVSLVLVATITSSIASVLLIFIIRRMKIWNGHILLVTTMTIFQLVYDLSFFTGVVNVGYGGVTIASNITQLFSGVASSLVSNWVAWVAFYVIYHKKSFDIFRNYNWMMFMTFIPATIDVILYVSAIADTSNRELIDVSLLVIYNTIKLFSIAANFVLGSWSSTLIEKMRSKTDRQSASEVSINTLSMRLFYYPLVQMISRIGCSWYELEYGYDFSPKSGFNFNPDHTTDAQFAAQCVMALSMPIASIGYLLIFLLMQPKAYICLMDLFNGRSGTYVDAPIVQPILNPISNELPEEDCESLSHYSTSRNHSIASSNDEMSDLRLSIVSHIPVYRMA